MCRADPTRGNYEIVILDHTTRSLYDLSFVIRYYLDAFPVCVSIDARGQNYSRGTLKKCEGVGEGEKEDAQFNAMLETIPREVIRVPIERLAV